jgi:hypothetical protein
MTQAWTPDGPISLPPRTLAYGAGAVIAAMAVVGIGLGFNASLRQSSAPGVEGVGQSASADGAPIASPIVELPPPVAAASDEASTNTTTNAVDAEADTIDAQTAAAQAVQSKPSKSAGDIDQILTSHTEKPPAPVKATADEAPPVKSDVPF